MLRQNGRENRKCKETRENEEVWCFYNLNQFNVWSCNPRHSFVWTDDTVVSCHYVYRDSSGQLKLWTDSEKLKMWSTHQDRGRRNKNAHIFFYISLKVVIIFFSPLLYDSWKPLKKQNRFVSLCIEIPVEIWPTTTSPSDSLLWRSWINVLLIKPLLNLCKAFVVRHILALSTDYCDQSCLIFLHQLLCKMTR